MTSTIFMSPQEDLEGAPLVAKKNRETARYPRFAARGVVVLAVLLVGGAIISIVCPGPVVSTGDIGVKSKDAADAEASTIEEAEQKLKELYNKIKDGQEKMTLMQLSAGCQSTETSEYPIRQEGTVSEVLGDHFRVELENGRIVMARLSGRMRNVQVCVGDKVVLETSSYDPSEGQIICRTR